MATRLTEYRRKRRFERTPEPAPTRPPSRAPRFPSFVVHKHDATRLHYDLRLEIDGALASWAIPKGPSYDPAEKRLAVETEDHPLEYGGFEGRIPEGEYGAGDSLLWDRGNFDTVPPGHAHEQRERGRLTVALNGQKLQGQWHLVRTRPTGAKQQWIIFKAKDGYEKPGYDVEAEHPESVLSGRRASRGPTRKKALRAPHPPPEALLERVWPPMKAVLAKPTLANEKTHLLEVKYDGYRGLAALSVGKLAFQTRNALDLAHRFPEIAAALRKVQVAEAVIDGEVVALDRKGISRFELLMTRAPHRFIAFDLLWLDGQDLRGRPLEERHELLESVIANAPETIALAERVDESVEAALEEARSRGLEGIMAKRRGSTYQGRRSADWLKLKVSANQEVAILGYTPISNGSDQIGALLIGVHAPDGFHYAGKVGTGFTTPVRRRLKQQLDALRSETPPAVDAPRMRAAIWTRPRFVAQVAFTEWTRDGRLRHPSFQGLREDKRPEDCVRERT